MAQHNDTTQYDRNIVFPSFVLPAVRSTQPQLTFIIIIIFISIHRHSLSFSHSSTFTDIHYTSAFTTITTPTPTPTQRQLQKTKTHLVIPPQQRHVRRKLEFEAEQQAERLYRVMPPVHQVPQKDVGCVRWPTPHRLEDVEQIKELPVQISHHRHGAGHRLDVGFLDEEFSGFLAELPELVWDFLVAINGPDLVEGADVRAESAVDAQDGLVDECGEAKAVKALDAVPPGARVSVLAEAFVVESVDLRDGSRLVIPPQQRHVRRKLEFEAEQQAERLYRVMPPVHQVPQKDVGCVRWPTPHRLEDVEQIKELPVQISHHRHGAGHRLDVGFLDEEFSGFLAELPELGFGNGVSLFQDGDAFVDVKG
eukprot:CAMPEP_0172379352 /NCGR_PEP_ID=MMETSP1060-20121228/69888_1 /TAXON_ID=37318 /ORGANISM="Pseudo-nitzschia pungens, Strain cf. cingulata" /LENGTH=365 /DNA_ID=CAMNT_0013107093 /DNA_START=1920 /DNA_END=3014 /DNA_ORIENTATION=+